DYCQDFSKRQASPVGAFPMTLASIRRKHVDTISRMRCAQILADQLVLEPLKQLRQCPVVRPFEFNGYWVRSWVLRPQVKSRFLVYLLLLRDCISPARALFQLSRQPTAEHVLVRLELHFLAQTVVAAFNIVLDVRETVADDPIQLGVSARICLVF